MNGRVLVIGAGGVATVAIVKMAMNSDIFKEIKIASRTKAKCDNIVKYINEKLPNCKAVLSTAKVDADDVEQLKALMNDYKPEIVVNLALRVLLAVGLPRAFRAGRSLRYPWLRFRPRRNKHLHGIRCKASL